MNIYQTTAIMSITAGSVMLSDEQAQRRKHLLVKTGSIGDVNLQDAEIDLLGDLPYSIYRVVGQMQLKAGEIFGYDGVIDKATAQQLLPAQAVIDQAELEPAPGGEDTDEELIEAIDALDPENAAHFNATNGKPDLAILSGLLDRKITGKQRDAAWAVLLDRVAATKSETEQQSGSE